MKLGIALSGGGIKSFSQLPVIRKLKEDNLKLSAISGTSMGSVIASLVASGIDIKIIEELCKECEKIFSPPAMKQRYNLMNLVP